MSRIQQFSGIDDYIKAANLNIDNKYPDFLVYDYEKASPDACKDLSTFRQNYYEIALEVSEGCNTMVDQFEHPVTESRLILISPHRLQTFRSHPETEEQHKGYGIFFKPEFIGADPAHSTLLWDFPFFSHLNSPFLPLEKKEAEHFTDIILRIHHEHDSEGAYSREIIRNYLRILFLKARQHYPGSADQQANGRNRDREIYEEFKQLVQSHYSEMKSVQEYAEKMYLTPKHLSETVKKVSGKSALEEIHQVQLNHAKALLRQTSKTVSEIAYELNFENPEYFSVFFKRLTGESPSRFRMS